MQEVGNAALLPELCDAHSQHSAVLPSSSCASTSDMAASALLEARLPRTFQYLLQPDLDQCVWPELALLKSQVHARKADPCGAGPSDQDGHMHAMQWPQVVRNRSDLPSALTKSARFVCSPSPEAKTVTLHKVILALRRKPRESVGKGCRVAAKDTWSLLEPHEQPHSMCSTPFGSRV